MFEPTRCGTKEQDHTLQGRRAHIGDDEVVREVCGAAAGKKKKSLKGGSSCTWEELMGLGWTKIHGNPGHPGKTWKNHGNRFHGNFHVFFFPPFFFVFVFLSFRSLRSVVLPFLFLSFLLFFLSYFFSCRPFGLELRVSQQFQVMITQPLQTHWCVAGRQEQRRLARQ